MLLAEGDWTPLKMFGVWVTIGGAIWYSYRKEKTRENKNTQREKERQSEDEENPLIENNDNGKFCSF